MIISFSILYFTQALYPRACPTAEVAVVNCTVRHSNCGGRINRRPDNSGFVGKTVHVEVPLNCTNALGHDTVRVGATDRRSESADRRES